MCDIEKSLEDDFYPHSSGWAWECKECAKKRITQYKRDNPDVARRDYLKNKETYVARAYDWRANNLTRAREISRDKEGRRRARKNSQPYEEVTTAQVIARYGGRCNLCYLKVGATELHVDHIIPISKGGAHVMANLAVTHATCNRRKHADETVHAGQYFEGWTP